MSQSHGGEDITITAAEDLRNSQYCVVKLTSSGAALCGAAENPFGVLQNAPNTGELACVRMSGTSKVVANGPFSVGDYLSSAASTGKVDTTGAGTTGVIGIAMEAAGKANVLVEATVDPGAVLSVADNAVTAAKLAASVAGAGLTGGGGTALSVVVDDSTIECPVDTLQVKNGGITAAKLAAAATGQTPYSHTAAGDITSSVAETVIGIAKGVGTIAVAGFTAANTGTDGSNPLSVAMNCYINGVSIFSTPPALAKTAADGATTLASGTGVTVGVIDPTKNILAAGDKISIAYTLTRTASPSDEMADLFAQIYAAYKVGV